LEVELGVGEFEIDLTDLGVRDMKASMGLGQTTVTLPRAGNFEAQIEGAVGQTTIIVPEDTATRIHMDTGIAGRQLPDSYQRHNDIYTSPGYESADSRVELRVSQAIGNVTIRHPE
jgi:predicted membrane protein